MLSKYITMSTTTCEQSTSAERLSIDEGIKYARMYEEQGEAHLNCVITNLKDLKSNDSPELSQHIDKIITLLNECVVANRERCNALERLVRQVAA